MANTVQNIPVEVIDKIIREAIQPYNYVETSSVISKCSQVGGFVAELARQQMHTFNLLLLRNAVDVDTVYSFLDNRTAPITVHAVDVRINRCPNSPLYAFKIASIIFSCDRAAVMDLVSIPISIQPHRSLQRLTKLVLQEVSFFDGNNVVQFLSNFPSLHHLSLSQVDYGSLHAATSMLPPTLSELYIQFDGDRTDEFLSWVVGHCRPSFGSLRSAGFLSIHRQVVDTLISFMDIYKELLTSLCLSVEIGDNHADYTLSKFLGRVKLPVVSYRNSSGLRSRAI